MKVQVSWRDERVTLSAAGGHALLSLRLREQLLLGLLGVLIVSVCVRHDIDVRL